MSNHGKLFKTLIVSASLALIASLALTLLPQPLRVWATGGGTETPLMGGSGAAVGSANTYMPVSGSYNMDSDGLVWEPIPATGGGMIASGGTLDVKLSAAPGSTYSRTLTLVKNSSATALTCTITGAATTGVLTGGPITVAAGDYVYWAETYSGSPASAVIYVGCVFTGATAGESIVMGCYGSANATIYAGISGANDGGSTTESAWEMPCPTQGTFKNLFFVKTSSGHTGSSYHTTATLRLGAASQALTTTYTHDTTGNSDTTHTVAVSAGDLLDLMAATNDTSSRFCRGMVFVPTTDGESIHMGQGQLSQTTSSIDGAPISTTETTNQVLAPVACTAYNFYVQVEAVHNITSTLYLRKNAGNTTLTVGLSSASSGHDTTHQPALAAGDLLTISCSSVATYYQNIGFVIYVVPIPSISAPTGVTATTNLSTKVTISWNTVTGATDYDVFKDGSDITGGYTVAVLTYDYTGADAPTITAGSAVASDGTSTSYVSLSLSGTSTSNGTSHTYTVKATDGTNNSAASSGATGYTIPGSLTYQWQYCATAGGTYANISGATSSTYNDSTYAAAPTITAGTATATDGTSTANVGLSISGASANNGTTEYYKCVLNATGCTQQLSANDGGYIGVGSLTYQWWRSGSDADSGYSSLSGATTASYNDTTAPAPTITAGTASATDGTSTSEVDLSISGASTSVGAGRYYYCVVSATGAASANTTHDRGYIGVGSLTYQWYVSAANSDASFSVIAGGTTAPYAYTSAPSAIITPGTAAASDGTSGSYVTLTVSGQSIAVGDGRYYYCAVSAAGALTQNTNHDSGYKSAGTLTYQWWASAADSDASYSSLSGATTSPYNDTTAPAGTLSVTTDPFTGFGEDWVIVQGTVGSGATTGRYYYCVVSATGATPQNTNHDRGYRSASGSVTQVGFNYGLTTSYGSNVIEPLVLSSGQSFVMTIRGLTPATVYNYQAEAYNGSWSTGGNAYVATHGSPVVYENLTTGGNANSQSIYGSQYVAQSFTVGATSHTVTQIILWLERVGSPGTITLSLYHATAGGTPTGAALDSATYSGNSLPVTWVQASFVFNSDSLQAGSIYAIVLSASNGVSDASDYVLWHQVSGGGGLTGAVGQHSTDGGNTWTSDTPANYMFTIYGNSCISIVSVLVSRDYIETGDMMFMLEYINTYPPYYQSHVANQYFQIRLLGTDGLTVIAATPMEQWDDMPGAIYLNANQAAQFTSGAAYYLEIYGTFSSHPVADYQLTAANWSGSVDDWLYTTAVDMEVYFTASTGTTTIFTTSVAGAGNVINDAGGSYFYNGIPYIEQVHPEMFLTVNQVPGFEPTLTPTATATVQAWQPQLGPTVSGMFIDLGTMFGIDGKYIGAGLVALIYLALVISVVGRGGSAIIAAAIGFPVLLIGVVTFVIDYTIIGVIMLVTLIIALIGYWITRT